MSQAFCDFSVEPIERASEAWQCWYRLAFTQGLSYKLKLKLLTHFTWVEAIFSANRLDLVALIGESPTSALLSEHGLNDGGVAEAIQACEQWLGKSPTHFLLSLADSRYPTRLLNLADPPLLLFVIGDPAVLNLPSVAIVGSRSASAQGIENAKAFAKALAAQHFNIVSGLALGIDAAAHRGALLAPGRTVAVIGTGIDRVYPAANHALAREITLQGAILSELPLGAPPLPHHFPKRNRLIAALSHGVLVVEAAMESGSLITARLALEIGREVFAIPGSIHSTVSKGSHLLIKQGAKLVESSQDIVEELSSVLASHAASLNAIPASQVAAPSFKSPKANSGSLGSHSLGFEDPILMAMGFEPVAPQELIGRCNLAPNLVQTRLLELELNGHISRLDDGRLLQIVEAT